MRVGPKPSRSDQFRRKLYVAVAADVVDSIRGMSEDDTRDFGTLYARVAAMAMATGAMMMASRLDPNEDFEDILENALYPIFKASSPEDVERLSSKCSGAAHVG